MGQVMHENIRHSTATAMHPRKAVSIKQGKRADLLMASTTSCRSGCISEAEAANLDAVCFHTGSLPLSGARPAGSGCLRRQLHHQWRYKASQCAVLAVTGPMIRADDLSNKAQRSEQPISPACFLRHAVLGGLQGCIKLA